jgi:hypothetical protein
MAEMEHLGEALSAPPDPEYWDRRTAAGWRLVGVEWARPPAAETAETAGDAMRPRRQEVPYGMRVADDCTHLEEAPQEMEVLAWMLRLIADDLALSEVARELNRAGFRDRSGGPWTQVAAFHLLPRLIEMAPRVRTSPVFRETRDFGGSGPGDPVSGSHRPGRNHA